MSLLVKKLEWQVSTMKVKEYTLHYTSAGPVLTQQNWGQVSIFIFQLGFDERQRIHKSYEGQFKKVNQNHWIN